MQAWPVDEPKRRTRKLPSPPAGPRGPRGLTLEILWGVLQCLRDRPLSASQNMTLTATTIYRWSCYTVYTGESLPFLCETPLETPRGANTAPWEHETQRATWSACQLTSSELFHILEGNAWGQGLESSTNDSRDSRGWGTWGSRTSQTKANRHNTVVRKSHFYSASRYILFFGNELSGSIV